MKNALPGVPPISHALIVTAAIAVVVAIVHAAASVIAPVLLAAFIAVIATPPLRWMKRMGSGDHRCVFISAADHGADDRIGCQPPDPADSDLAWPAA